MLYLRIKVDWRLTAYARRLCCCFSCVCFFFPWVSSDWNLSITKMPRIGIEETRKREEEDGSRINAIFINGESDGIRYRRRIRQRRHCISPRNQTTNINFALFWFPFFFSFIWSPPANYTCMDIRRHRGKGRWRERGKERPETGNMKLIRVFQSNPSTINWHNYVDRNKCARATTCRCPMYRRLTSFIYVGCIVDLRTHSVECLAASHWTSEKDSHTLGLAVAPFTSHALSLSFSVPLSFSGCDHIWQMDSDRN